jgi:NAD-dependent SIR2 family protein deacetylase
MSGETGVTTESLLKEALQALGNKYLRCRKCHYVWKPNYRAKKKKYPKPVRCSNCRQTCWEKGYTRKHRSERTWEERGRYGHAHALKMIRQALLERALLLRESERLDREARVRELIRRMDEGGAQ